MVELKPDPHLLRGAAVAADRDERLADIATHGGVGGGILRRIRPLVERAGDATAHLREALVERDVAGLTGRQRGGHERDRAQRVGHLLCRHPADGVQRGGTVEPLDRVDGAFDKRLQ
ncbi:MAG: hypothetical protein IPK81_17640 [Rhodospirillales bacterium]|nr:MAG: hypothetical protein IPK81_17640 [Rhodospirillales bacterium]